LQGRLKIKVKKIYWYTTYLLVHNLFIGTQLIYWYTTYGEISICESRFTKNNILDRPFSYSADIQCRGYSAPLQRRMTDFGADDSFAKTSAKMEEHYYLAPEPLS